MSNFKVDFSKSVGFDLGDQAVAWGQRDCLLYNVSLYPFADSATPHQEELSYLYEKSKGFRVIPSYPLVLPLKGETSEVNDFAKMVGGRGAVDGFPKLDPNTIVHAEQSLELHSPIPTSSGEGWKLQKRVSAVHDKKSGLIMETEAKLVDPKGKLVATMIGSSFYRGGGQGTNFSKSIASKPPTASPPADRSPDFSHTTQTSGLQAALYRLSGDYNPLHIDASIGAGGGLGGVILHGLCSYGIAVRALLKALDPEDGLRGESGVELRAISARFTSPVKPGDTLKTDVWFIGQESGDEVLAFEQTVMSTGKKSLGGGRAVFKAGRASAGNGNGNAKL